MLNETTMTSAGTLGTQAGVAQFPDWGKLYEGMYDKTESMYARLGHSLGFNPPIVSSVRAFEAKPRLLLMGLNPAGSRDYPEHRGRYRFEHQDGYLGTSWDGYPTGQSPLQKQVGQLLRHLQRRVGDDGPLDLFARNRVVSASLIPFRSPSEASLHNRPASLDFARTLWGEVLGVWRPQYVVCFGGTPFNVISSLLGMPSEARDYDPRWQGLLRLRVFDDGVRLLGVPHMSRFPIFGRAASAPAINSAFDDLFDRLEAERSPWTQHSESQ